MAYATNAPGERALTNHDVNISNIRLHLYTNISGVFSSVSGRPSTLADAAVFFFFL